MSDGALTEREICKAAQAEADHYVPPLKDNAGRDMVIVFVAVLLFCLLAGLNTKEYRVEMSVLAVVGGVGLIHFARFKYRDRQHSKAFWSAYRRMTDEAGARRAGTGG